MPYTDLMDQVIINTLFRNGPAYGSTPTAYTFPYLNSANSYSLFFGLFTAMPGKDGTGGTEVSGNAYARQSVAVNNLTNFKDPSTSTVDQTNNVNAITWPAATPSGWGTVIGVGVFDALTSGNLLAFQTLIRSGDGPYFYSAQTSGNTFYAPGSSFSNGDTVRLVPVSAAVTNSVVPGGFSVNTLYYVVSASTDTFSLSATSGGSAITVTSNGGGVLYREGSKTVGINDVIKFAANAFVFGLD